MVARRLCLALLATLLALHAGDPWRYLHEDNGRRFSSYARSHLALGLARTHGHDFFTDRTTGRMEPYGHHPPGLSLLLAAWFRFCGSDAPAAARLLAAAFHLASAALLLRLLGELYPGPPGLIAGLALAVVPMSAFFGKLVNYEPFVLPFVILLVSGYWRWAEEGRLPPFVRGLVLAVPATLVDWPIFLALATVAGDAGRRWLRGGGPRFLRASVATAAVGLGAFGLAAGWLAAGPAGLGELAGAAAFRVRLGDEYSWVRWLGKVLEYNRRYFTEPLLAGSLVTTTLLVREARRGPLEPRARLVALFGVAGLLPVVVFPNGARYHAYWQFYLLPFATLGLAHALERAGRRLAPARVRWLYALVVAWVLVASGWTLRTRYTRPSGYVAKMVAGWERYL